VGIEAASNLAGSHPESQQRPFIKALLPPLGGIGWAALQDLPWLRRYEILREAELRALI
jgi:hypothetical protein